MDAQMNKKILFFWPNTSNRGRITMSIPILAGIAKDMGWQVKYFDTSFYEKPDDSFQDREKTGTFKKVKHQQSEQLKPSHQAVKDLQKNINDFQPDVLAITGMTNDFQYMMANLSHVQIPFKTNVIFGGAHAINNTEEILKTSVSVVCFGQGESVLPEILTRIENGHDLNNIPGTSYRHPNTGQIERFDIRSTLSEKQIWATAPNYSFYDQRYYSYPFDGKMVNMFWLEVGRGCPYSCTYCEAPQIKKMYKGKGKYVVTRPLDSIFSTIKSVQENYDIDVFNITHECFLSQKKEWLKDFCKRWKEEVGKTFLIQTRMETVTEEKLDILKTSGAPIIQIGQGIESGNQRILKDICNRRMDIENVVKSYQLMKEMGFRTNAFYMIGFPTETRNEIFETIELCRRVDADVDSVSIFQPYPGLPLTKMCIENGWITGKETIPSFTEKSIINQPSISPHEVSNLHRVFLLYAKLPNTYRHDIKKCEDNPNKTELFKKLMDLRWSLHE
jgi:anaerobic magnesium-protoporphyrin IX monomethyl ester cyclase